MSASSRSHWEVTSSSNSMTPPYVRVQQVPHLSYALSFSFHRNVSYLFLHLPLVRVHCHTVRQSVLPDLKWYCASNEQPLQRSRCHKGCWWQIHCSCSALLRSTDMNARSSYFTQVPLCASPELLFCKMGPPVGHNHRVSASNCCLQEAHHLCPGET